MKESREEKLTRYQRLHRKLTTEGEGIYREYKTAENKWRNHNKKIRRVGQAIYDLKHDGDTPTITDHAIVRYLERIEGVDINDLKVKVANHKMAHKEGNVIVTVNGELGDQL